MTLLLVIGYVSIANLAMYMTCREHAQTGQRNVLWTLVGITACVAWPVVIVAMVIMARRKAPAMTGAMSV